ncbi:uncharacterized protein [Diadema antillarum]|uniref:uncharacterized protein n=1 Tax=Diadema antillarum TaxID=105358 RepID=UPI003A8AEA1B
MASGTVKLSTLVNMMVMITHCYGNAERDPIVTGTDIRDVINPRILSPQLQAKQPAVHEVSLNCSQGLRDLLVQKEGLIPALDAFGRPTPGMLVGNTAWVGHFDECMGITDFKYCLVDLDANITVDSNSSKIDILTLKWITVGDLSGSAAHCTEKNVAFSAGFIGTWVLIGFLLVLSLIGTVADKYLKRKEVSEANLLSKPTSNGLTLDEKSRATPNHYGSTDMINTLAEGGQGSKVGNGTSGDDGKSDLCVTVEDGNEVTTLDIASTSQPPPEAAAETTPLMDVSGRENRRKRKEKAGIILRFLLCFAISDNLPKILSTKPVDGDVPCLNGIRVISICVIILFHSSNYKFAGFNDDSYSGIAIFYASFTSQLILQGLYFVDAFFLLSGFLLTYLTLRRMKASDGKMDWIWFYLNRHFRLTPALAMLILIRVYIVPEMNQGPIWYREESGRELCRSYWWTGILFINNFFPPTIRAECVNWTWYLACDMQFYYLSPLLLIPLYRLPKIGVGAIFATCIASFITTAVIVLENNFRITDGYAFPQTEPDAFFEATVYIKPYCRISPYLVGMMLGYLIQHIGKRKLTLKSAVVAGGWVTAVILYMVVIYGLYDVYRGASTLNLAASVLYITFSRFIFALAIIFSAAFISLSYFCALGMCLLVEFPFINLGKMLMTEVKEVRGNGKRNTRD